jgi:RimJ/RimL family protein N-acetyltransferase
MAVIPAKTVHLGDGTTVLIRCAGESEALALIEAAKNILADGDGMVGELDEFNKTEEQEKEWIRALNENPTNLLLVAEVEGRIVGNIDFHSAKRRRVCHVGEFGMSVQPGWRSCGVGSAPLESLVAWAKAVQELEKITLRVRADNPRGIALYNKHGFSPCGLAKDAIKLSDGIYVDEITMERFVRS